MNGKKVNERGMLYNANTEEKYSCKNIVKESRLGLKAAEKMQSDFDRIFLDIVKRGKTQKLHQSEQKLKIKVMK